MTLPAGSTTRTPAEFPSRTSTLTSGLSTTWAYEPPLVVTVACTVDSRGPSTMPSRSAERVTVCGVAVVKVSVGDEKTMRGSSLESVTVTVSPMSGALVRPIVYVP